MITHRRGFLLGLGAMVAALALGTSMGSVSPDPDLWKEFGLRDHYCEFWYSPRQEPDVNSITILKRCCRGGPIFLDGAFQPGREVCDYIHVPHPK